MKMMSMRKLALGSALALATLCGTSAQATVVAWTGGSDFDSERITFDALTADQLSIDYTAPSGVGGYIHSHSGAMNFSIKLLLDGAWTTIYTQTLTSGAQQNLAALSTIYFTSGVVSGLWLDSAPAQGQSYHALNRNVVFDFTQSETQAVPEPASLALMGLGLAGLALRRRKH